MLTVFPSEGIHQEQGIIWENEYLYIQMAATRFKSLNWNAQLLELCFILPMKIWDLPLTGLTSSGIATFCSKYVLKGSSWATGDAGGEMELYWFVEAPFSCEESSEKTHRREKTS